MSEQQQFQQSQHNLLFIPGPIELSDEVLLANAHPSVSHVSPPFISTFSQTLKYQKSLVFSEHCQPFITAGSGTLGWESVGCNLVNPGDDVLVLNTGYFGDEFANCLTVHGGNIQHLRSEIGNPTDIKELESILSKKQFKIVTITHVDTSTAVLQDIKTISEVIHKIQPQALVVVDGVCSVGSELIKFDDWGIDVLLSASQKGISAPPGLSLLWVSKRALSVHENVKESSYYTSWNRWLPVMNAYESGQPSYFATPPVQLIYALNKSLSSMIDHPSFTLLNRFEKHKEVNEYVRNYLKSTLNLKLLVKDERYQSNSMLTILYPDGIAASTLLPKILSKGVVVAGGLHKECKDKYFRVGTMGESVVNSKRNDIQVVLSAIEKSIKECLP